MVASMKAKGNEQTDKQIRVEKSEKKNTIAGVFTGIAIAAILFQWLNIFDFQFLFSIAILLIFIALIIYRPESFQKKRRSKGHLIAIVSMIPIFLIVSYIFIDVTGIMRDFRVTRIRNQLVDLIPDYIEIDVRRLSDLNRYIIDFEVNIEYFADINFGELTLNLVEYSRNILHERYSFEGDWEGYTINIVAEASNELIWLYWQEEFENSRLTFQTSNAQYPFGDLSMNFGNFWRLPASGIRNVHLSLVDEFTFGALRAKELDELLSNELSMEIEIRQILDMEDDQLMDQGGRGVITDAQFHSHSISVRFPAYRSLRYFADDVAQIQAQIEEIMAEQGIDLNLNTDWFELSLNTIEYRPAQGWHDYTEWIEIAGTASNELYVLSENAMNELINEELLLVLYLEDLLLEQLDVNILELRILPNDTDDLGEPTGIEMRVHLLMESLPENNSEIQTFLTDLGLYVNEILAQNDRIFRSLHIHLPEYGNVESFHSWELEE